MVEQVGVQGEVIADERDCCFVLFDGVLYCIKVDGIGVVGRGICGVRSTRGICGGGRCGVW